MSWPVVCSLSAVRLSVVCLWSVRLSLAFHIFYISSRTISWIKLKVLAKRQRKLYPIRDISMTAKSVSKSILFKDWTVSNFLMDVL